MGDPEKWTRLFVARWPDGAVTLLGAESLEHAADLLDQVDNAAECEVVPFEGDLWLTLSPADDPAGGPLVLRHRPTLEIDSQTDIVEKAYPVLHKVLEAARRPTEDGDIHEEPIDPKEWQEARAIERDRILAPSAEWRSAVERWWDMLGPRDEPTGDRDE